MKKIAAALMAVTLFAPMFSFADTMVPIQPTVSQLLTRVAALNAQISAQAGAPLACAALFSAPQVAIGQTVVLAWGSVGALAPGSDPNQSMWPQDGASVESFDKIGTWTYSFTFYGQSGNTIKCTASVRVVASS
jgi:hypothetical protein